jgi:hypothetical protein
MVVKVAVNLIVFRKVDTIVAAARLLNQFGGQPPCSVSALRGGAFSVGWQYTRDMVAAQMAKIAA